MSAEPTKPLVLILKSMRLPRLVVEKMEAAGYCVVEVKSFDGIRQIDWFQMTHMSAITDAALRAILGSYEATKSAFGTGVAKALLTQPPKEP